MATQTSIAFPTPPSSQVDHVGLAKITRKVLDRVAPFCYMQESSLDRSNSNPLASSTFSSPAASPSASVTGLPLIDSPSPNDTTTPSASGTPRVIVLSAPAQTKLVGKIKARVTKIVSTIDAHIHAAQVAFKMCREGMVLCDESVRGSKAAPKAAPVQEQPVATPGRLLGLDVDDSTRGATGTKTRGERKPTEDGWEVDIDPDESDDRGMPAPVDEHHRHGTSGHHFLLHFAHQGLELARKTEECFKEVRQEAYKIAAQTKDHAIPVLVPSGPGQPPTVRKHLKDVGLDIVASLTLLESDFGRRVKDTVLWWQWVIEDLEKGEHSSLCPLSKGRDPQALGRAYSWWEEAKEGWQAYYDVIATLHIAYHDLLISSARAWDGTTVVVKTHRGSDEHLSHSNSNRGAPQMVVIQGDGEEYEVLERQLVPPTESQAELALNPGQDASAKRYRVVGLMMWRTEYTTQGALYEEPDSIEKSGGPKKKGGLLGAWKARRGKRAGGVAKETAQTSGLAEVKTKKTWKERLGCF
ncbi:hypothetical protein DFP72DRAFT_1065191 [Ephemerocybe angulata]|uniref:Uncharacterized protein n=1 Tax=Ephemerocybe angulata TaxID=980116 RepID=A0A8H6I4U4_9AGAR|nr:hypothetical protein DFP72DRAFT_1065191 [Tulosesus angulatus]